VSCAAASYVRTSTTGHIALPARGDGDSCRLHHRAGRVVGGQEDLYLRLPSLLWQGVELARVQLTAAWVEPVHAHLAPAYPVRCGRGRTRPRVTHDGQDRTPHADEDPFF
jgi:hypothetical protein